MGVAYFSVYYFDLIVKDLNGWPFDQPFLQVIWTVVSDAFAERWRGSIVIWSTFLNFRELSVANAARVVRELNEKMDRETGMLGEGNRVQGG